MVETALPADWEGGFENTLALGQNEAKDPATQLAIAARKFGKLSGTELLLDVISSRAYIRPLFKGRTVQIVKLKQYNSRLQGLSLEAFGEWSAALRARCKDTKDWMAAYEVIQVESFWSGDKVTDPTKKQTLARLASVTGFEG